MTLLRAYKSLNFPHIPMDLTTITRPMSSKARQATGLLWTALGHISLKDLGLRPLAVQKVASAVGHPASILSGFHILGSMWTQVGPNGKGLFARILDIVNLRRNAQHVQDLDILLTALKKLPYFSLTSDAHLRRLSVRGLLEGIGDATWYRALVKVLRTVQRVKKLIEGKVISRLTAIITPGGK